MKTSAAFALLCAPLFAVAEETPAQAAAERPAIFAPAEQRFPASPAKSEALAPSRRGVSPRVAAMLAAAAAKIEPAKPTSEAPVGAGVRLPLAERDSAASIVRLPQYVVREPKVPTPTEVMTQREVARMAMDRYLGSIDGLDRGFLNRFTLGELWRKIPVLGVLPMPIPNISNEDRAMIKYNEDERLRKMHELLDLGTITARSGDPVLGKRIEQETMQTFRWK